MIVTRNNLAGPRFTNKPFTHGSLMIYPQAPVSLRLLFFHSCCASITSINLYFEKPASPTPSSRFSRVFQFLCFCSPRPNCSSVLLPPPPPLCHTCLCCLSRCSLARLFIQRTKSHNGQNCLKHSQVKPSQWKNVFLSPLSAHGFSFWDYFYY